MKKVVGGKSAMSLMVALFRKELLLLATSSHQL